jgi:hypothetical protein
LRRFASLASLQMPLAETYQPLARDTHTAARPIARAARAGSPSKSSEAGRDPSRTAEASEHRSEPRNERSDMSGE